MQNNVMAAMSGGVDSSIAAALLLEQGYHVAGATLRLFPKSGAAGALSDADYARSAAQALQIGHHVFDFEEDFRREVVGYFARAYQRGLTPNPCIVCNRRVKFQKLIERALALGMDAVATGHYARVEKDGAAGRWLLKKAADAAKDQTYVLALLTQEQLSRSIFPLGGLTKREVRAKAEKLGLLNADKPDSQDICFVPGGDYASFIENVLGMKSAPGDFVDMSGRILGRHRGVIHYTVGQRRGLGLSSERPKYVIRKDAVANTVVVGDEEALYSGAMTVEGLNLISVEAIGQPVRATVKTRYSQKETAATLYPPENGRMTVVFDTPQRAVTPGQGAVFYDGDTVIGGGTIV